MINRQALLQDLKPVVKTLKDDLRKVGEVRSCSQRCIRVHCRSVTFPGLVATGC